MRLAKRTTVAAIPEAAGADEVAYNPSTSEVIAARLDGHLVIVDARTNHFVHMVTTVSNAHSVATDPNTKHIYVPEPGRGVEILIPG